MTKIQNGIFTFSLFKQFPDLVISTSTRKHGDMREVDNRNDFFEKLDIDSHAVISLTQVHGSDIIKVGRKNLNEAKSKNGDGLTTSKKNVFLSVVTADCVPIFFYEPKASICGIVHAGWKGTLEEITKKMIEKLKSMGGNVHNIYIGIGPHIGACCYSVPTSRIDLFQKKFENDPLMLFQDGDSYYLDLGYISTKQLLASGIAKERIAMPITCTSCQIKRFFSYRKDKKEQFGEMISIIGMTT